MATNEILTKDPHPVTPPDRSILAVLAPLFIEVCCMKVLELSASLVAWYAQTINTFVPACIEERQCLSAKIYSQNEIFYWLLDNNSNNN